MDVSDEKFWAALREAVRQARETEVRELEEAERLLAETEEVDGERLSEERIAAMVERAVGGRVDAEQHEAAPAQTKPPVIRLAGRSPWLAAAAAMLMAPNFLIAATAVTVTVVAVSAYLLRNTTDTLSFSDAVNIMLDSGESDENRDAAQGRAYLNFIESIELLRKIGNEDSDLSAQATSALDRLRGALDDSEPFVRRGFDEPYESLAERATVAQLGSSQRQDSLAELVEQVAYGIRALKSVRRSGGPLDRQDKTDARLMVIARKLQ